jgi:hypothetical protein
MSSASVRAAADTAVAAWPAREGSSVTPVSAATQPLIAASDTSAVKGAGATRLRGGASAPDPRRGEVSVPSIAGSPPKGWMTSLPTS